jgi:SanA protein
MPKKKIYIVIFTAILLFISPNILVKWNSRGKTFDNIDNIPHNKVGLLLGTSKYSSKGVINLYYKYRIDAIIELFNAHKIDFILISGDNSMIEYNEPQTIRKDLIARGIPDDKIYLDYAGFRTWDSVIRAKKVFEENSFTVVSQKFHNERAIFIGSFNNMNIIGYNAKDVSIKYGRKTNFRELFARIKLIIDIIGHKQPKYLGNPIIIGND